MIIVKKLFYQPWLSISQVMRDIGMHAAALEVYTKSLLDMNPSLAVRYGEILSITYIFSAGNVNHIQRFKC